LRWGAGLVTPFQLQAPTARRGRLSSRLQERQRQLLWPPMNVMSAAQRPRGERVSK
jgi:hypothetical protein